MWHARFEGWYYKQRGADGAVALIVARHADPSGAASASLQIISDAGAWRAFFPASEMRMDGPRVRLAGSSFSENGISLDVRANGLRAGGVLSFGPTVPPRGDIMGPFRFAPGMECRHAVASMRHTVDGAIEINGKRYAFQSGAGYIEGDRGTSFPRRYVWTHADWEKNSLMLSVADVPFHGHSFVGCVGFVYRDDRETRIASYRGARVLEAGNDFLVVRQGKLTLAVKADAQKPRGLLAPQMGGMTRTIHESAACPVHYRLTAGQETLFNFVCDQASFEGNWQDPFS
jgi:hypothetical protein